MSREDIMKAGQSLISELEDAIQSGSKDKRVDSLRRITDLFVANADRLNDQQIEVFDDVLGQLIKRIEGKALAELSRRLGPIANSRCLRLDSSMIETLGRIALALAGSPSPL